MQAGAQLYCAYVLLLIRTCFERHSQGGVWHQLLSPVTPSSIRSRPKVQEQMGQMTVLGCFFTHLPIPSCRIQSVTLWTHVGAMQLCSEV